ncbi:MAG: ISKra4 family transposase, partial [Oligoflexia bacterium]|nr:ISKra4 family transposase [Oligoflexia bacterium]
MKKLKPSSEAAKEQIEKTYNYLYDRKDKINYGKAKRGGFHIGSGGIES